MEPITPPTTAPAEPLVEFVRTQRQNAGAILAVLAVLFLGSTVYLYMQAGRTTAPDKAADKRAAEKLEPPDAKPAAEAANPKRTDYLIGAALTLFAGLATGVLALWLIGGLAEPDEAGQRSSARMQILAVGGVLGLLLMVAGAVYFYQWADSLGTGFEKGKRKELVWVVVPLLLVLAGAALMLAAVQPARAEERNNPNLRRLVYGSNLALTSMLLFVVLIGGNVVLAYHVDNKFDTTSSGFYSMSDQTREFLASLEQPIVAYDILQGSGERDETDLRDVLNRFQEASRGKFKVNFVSAVSNTIELASMKIKYPPIRDGSLGVLLTFANDPDRFSFIPKQEFLGMESQPSGEERRPRPTFVGEQRLIKELMFLADNKQRPKIYFTQGPEQMQLEGQRGDPRRSMGRLKSFLEQAYMEVLPWRFDEAAPEVPEDCTILVVPDPQTPLPPKQVEAIQKYMTAPRPGKKNGKLLLVSGATGNFRALTVAKTGLDSVLAHFNVALHDRFVFGWSNIIKSAPTSPIVVPDPDLASRHSQLANVLEGSDYTMLLPRVVEPRQGVPTFAATALLTTATDGGAWEEDDIPSDFTAAVVAARKARALKQTLPVGVVVSENTPDGNVGRVAVIGDGLFLSDWFVSQFPSGGRSFSLVSAVLDWLRDRPPVPQGVLAKTYSFYTLTNAKTVDKSRLEYLPLGLVVLAVSGIGMGVWITRRQQA